MRKRKILSVVLAMVMVLSTLPVLSAGAFTYGSEDGFYYYIDDKNAILNYYQGDAVDLVIPETLGGYPVIEISGSGALEWSTSVKSITSPST